MQPALTPQVPPARLGHIQAHTDLFQEPKYCTGGQTPPQLAPVTSQCIIPDVKLHTLHSTGNGTGVFWMSCIQTGA